MTRDDIIRMAREAGYQPLNPDAIFDCLAEVFFERFAELVAAAERERCAKVCEEFAKTGYDLTGDLELHEFIRGMK